jgi:hypothetical protein
VGDRQRWRRTRVRLGAAQEGLGTRVSGVKARCTGAAGLNKPREALACGPMARSAVHGREPKLGSGSGSVRPEVEDDRRPPPKAEKGCWAGSVVAGPSRADGACYYMKSV